jgi:hypothetical protein
MARHLLAGARHPKERIMSSRFASSLLFALALASAASLAACADDGVAPTVRDLSVTPQAMEVGKQATLTANVTFDDADGDVSSVLAEIVVPGGASQQLAPQAIPGDGIKSAPVRLVVILLPPTAGEYTLNVWVRDKEGHDSPKLTQKLTAQ